MADRKSEFEDGLVDRLKHIQKEEGREPNLVGKASATSPIPAIPGLEFIPFDQAPRRKAGLVICRIGSIWSYKSGYSHCGKCNWPVKCDCLISLASEAYWIDIEMR